MMYHSVLIDESDCGFSGICYDDGGSFLQWGQAMKVVGAIVLVIAALSGCVSTDLLDSATTARVHEGLIFYKEAVDAGDGLQYSLFVLFTPRIADGDSVVMCVVNKGLYDQAEPGDRYDYVVNTVAGFRLVKREAR